MTTATRTLETRRKRYYLLPDMANLLRASQPTITEWFKAGLIPRPIEVGPHRRRGRQHYLWDVEEVETFLASEPPSECRSRLSQWRVRWLSQRCSEKSRTPGSLLPGPLVEKNG
jgi:hypothetical protein